MLITFFLASLGVLIMTGMPYAHSEEQDLDTGGGNSEPDDVSDILAGDDHIVGTDDGDAFRGGAGGDTLLGGAGDDTIEGEDGDDLITGDLGDDDLYGGAGYDFIYGGKGEDDISGGADGDTIYGGEGDDLIYGGTGDDKLIDVFGKNVVDGGLGDDVLRVGKASTAFGGDGDDSIYLMDGGTAFGGDGADILTVELSGDASRMAVVRDFDPEQDALIVQLPEGTEISSLVVEQITEGWTVMLNGAAVVRVIGPASFGADDVVVMIG